MSDRVQVMRTLRTCFDDGVAVLLLRSEDPPHTETSVTVPIDDAPSPGARLTRAQVRGWAEPLPRPAGVSASDIAGTSRVLSGRQTPKVVEHGGINLCEVVAQGGPTTALTEGVFPDIGSDAPPWQQTESGGSKWPAPETPAGAKRGGTGC